MPAAQTFAVTMTLSFSGPSGGEVEDVPCDFSATAEYVERDPGVGINAPYWDVNGRITEAWLGGLKLTRDQIVEACGRDEVWRQETLIEHAIAGDLLRGGDGNIGLGSIAKHAAE